MRSIVGDASEVERPRGVMWIALVLFAMAGSMVVYGALTASSRIAFTRAAWLIGIEAAQLGPLVFAAGAVAYVVCGAGLLRLAKWARWMAIVLIFVGLAQQVPTVSVAVAEFHWVALIREALFFVTRMVALHYLFKEDVREAFEKR